MKMRRSAMWFYTLRTRCKKGAALSASLKKHPKLFGKIYASMVSRGRRGGPASDRDGGPSRICWSTKRISARRSEGGGGVSGICALFWIFFTVAILLTVVLPRLFSMLEEFCRCCRCRR